VIYGAGITHKVDADHLFLFFQFPSRCTLRRIRGRGTEIDIAKIVSTRGQELVGGCVDVNDLDLVPFDLVFDAGHGLNIHFHSPEHPQRCTLLFVLETNEVY
jgi:hypothetical protein